MRNFITFVEKFTRYCETVLCTYTYSMSKDKRVFLVNKDVAYVSCLSDFVGILYLITGHNTTSSKLFLMINEKILSNMADKTRFESIKDVFIDHLCKSHLVDAFVHIITTKLLLKRSRSNSDVESFYFHSQTGLVRLLAFFINKFLQQVKDFEIRELMLVELMQSLKVYTTNINRHEIYYNNLDELMDLFGLLESLEVSRGSPEIEKTVTDLEEIKFKKLFYFIQCKNKTIQMSSVTHLNNYCYKTHGNKAAYIQNVVKKRPIIEALFIKYPNEVYLNKLSPFFIFLSPHVAYEDIRKLLRIKRSAQADIAECIKKCLNVFMQKMDIGVSLEACR